MYKFVFVLFLGCVGVNKKDVCLGTNGGTEDPCDSIDNDCNGQVDEAGAKPTWYADDDGDGVGSTVGITECAQPLGYVADSADCDDTNAAVNPSATELCDGIDNNCDGKVDEGVLKHWFLDVDSDGYGGSTQYTGCSPDPMDVLIGGDCDDGDRAVNPSATEVCNNIDDDCDGVTDAVDNDGDGFGCVDDCNDADAEVNPNATEYCDGIDNNCDRVVDEESAADATTWYVDLDTDGYGDDGATGKACTRIENTVDIGGDCADFVSAINPGATEVCNGIDDNCDGSTDDASATNAKIWYADSDGDGYGDSAIAIVACDQPAGYIRSGGDCDDNNTAYNPGASEEDCTDINDYNCDGSVGYADTDGDGFAACQECDDSDAAVNSAATEVCNGIDDNCDGSTDGSDAAGQTTWYADSDNDGYGTDLTEVACERPDHYSDVDGDCDDGTALVSPANVEVCDGIDNNCDGAVDENEAIWYADTDSDGYGDPATAVTDCSQPPGYVTDGTDCDDNDSATNPGATEDCADSSDYNCDGSVGYNDADGDGFAACEDCNDSDAAVNPDAIEICDSLDNDCDGSTDDGAADATAWYIDRDEDAYGDAAISAASCDQPTGYVANADDCDDTNFAANPAAMEVCDGSDNDCNGLIDGSDAVNQLIWYMDSDGDGYGGTASATISCTQPTGYAANATDCDDTAANAFPGNGEVCDDGIDGACNGAWDEACATGGDSGADSGGHSGGGGDSGGGDTSGGDSGSGHSGDSGADSGGAAHGTFANMDFGDGGTCATAPWMNGSGGMIHNSMTYSNGAGICGSYVYGGGSVTGPASSGWLFYEGVGFTTGTVYTAEMTVENTLPSAVGVYADFGAGTISSTSLSGGASGIFTVSWTADSTGAADLRVWTSSSTNFDVVLHGAVITY